MGPRGFGSDNHSGVHPLILQGINKVNAGHAPAYGTDPISHQLQVVLEKIFNQSIEHLLVFNGTAANVLCLDLAIESHNSVLATDCSHLNVDECGSPEAWIGCKIIPVRSHNGKLTIAELQKHLIRRGDQHFSQPKIISVTQPTELGTTYTIDELKDITAWAQTHGLLVHMDGARLANAAAFLQTSLKAITSDVGIDLLSFGGTKNGLLGGELVIVFNKDLQKNGKFKRKQMGQLPSKTRFLAQQFISYFENQLYLEIANHALSLAQSLHQQLVQFKEIKIPYPTESNAVFPIFPKAWHKRLREKFFYYIWDEESFMARLMTSWDTTEQDINDFIGEVKKLSAQGNKL